MKKLVLLLTLTTLFVSVGSTRSLADYHHDDHGWYDEHNQRHDYIYHHHHRGYWDQHNGVRVFINV